jgi:hypothetical protein
LQRQTTIEFLSILDMFLQKVERHNKALDSLGKNSGGKKLGND